MFEGGFLGLDNITVVDRSDGLPPGATLKQSDATGWMGMFCLNMMRIALELARENEAYLVLATKFFEHYVYIGAAMKNMGGRDYELWSRNDGFFYDVLRYADGSYHKFRVRLAGGADSPVCHRTARDRLAGTVPRIPHEPALVPEEPRHNSRSAA